MPNPRNPVARAPILRKGGVHQRARSGERQQARQSLDELLMDGLEEYQDYARAAENRSGDPAAVASDDTAEKRAGDKDVLPDAFPNSLPNSGFMPAFTPAFSRPNPHTV